jgi:hypothetical protein
MREVLKKSLYASTSVENSTLQFHLDYEAKLAQ